MENVALHFIFILLGGFAVAVAITVFFYLMKQRKVQRLKDPHRDHYR